VNRHPLVLWPRITGIRRQTLHTNEQSKDYFFVILSVAKNLSFKAAEIRNEAALRSE
jgi:hypothetical protein